MSGKLTVGSLRGLPQIARARPARRALAVGAGAGADGGVGGASAASPQSGTELPPSRRGQRCCRTGCAGCPYGEAIRRARAASTP